MIEREDKNNLTTAHVHWNKSTLVSHDEKDRLSMELMTRKKFGRIQNVVNKKLPVDLNDVGVFLNAIATLRYLARIYVEIDGGREVGTFLMQWSRYVIYPDLEIGQKVCWMLFLIQLTHYVIYLI